MMNYPGIVRTFSQFIMSVSAQASAHVGENGLFRYEGDHISSTVFVFAATAKQPRKLQGGAVACVFSVSQAALFCSKLAVPTIPPSCPSRFM